MVQGELFREDSSLYVNNFEVGSKRSFLSRHQLILTLDKALLIFLGLMVVFVLTYSFGVERGKRAMEKYVTSLFPTHSESFQPTDQEAESLGVSGNLQETVLTVKQEGTASTTTANLPSKPGPQGAALVPTLSGTPDLWSVVTDTAKEGKYTVQLVTYKDEKLAVREVGRLKSKGHQGFVIPSGSFYQVCADYFETLSKARSLLRKFQESGRYPDAFVRPVIRTAGAPS